LKLPIYEPGLEEIVKKKRGKNLLFTKDVDNSIYSADIIFISVGTPTKNRGIGAGQAAELRFFFKKKKLNKSTLISNESSNKNFLFIYKSFVEMAARKIANISKNSKIIIEKSTVPCKTADHIRTILNANKINNGTMNNCN